MSRQPAANLRLLVGKDLVQLCVSQHQVIMHFHPNVSVSFETAVSAEPSGGGRGIWTPPPAAGASLIPFLGRRVESADVDGAGNLVLAFGDGTVRVQRDDSGYESYQVAGPDLQVIV